MSDQIKAARDAMEAARKKLTLEAKSGGNKAEAAYAEAYATLCGLDPATYRPLRKKYGRG